MINYSQQSIKDSDIKRVTDVLTSGFLTQGPLVPVFEKKISNICNSQYATACNSATSGLHLACMAMELKKNDIVWTSPNSFVASANCALYCGAKIDFVDIDIHTRNICTNKLIEKLSIAKKKGNLPKIIIVVHFAGAPCDMQILKKLSQKYKFKIIEDASHALGAKYKNGEPVGSCKYSICTIFSFHPVKIITTGEGGAVTTNNSKIDKKLKLLRTHGIEKKLNYITKQFNNKNNYDQKLLGYNYRMSDIHAALGISQLERLREFIKKRNIIANFYKKELCNLPILKQQIHQGSTSSYHLYNIQISFRHAHINKLKKIFKSKNILINSHYSPIHLNSFYKKIGFKSGDFPKSELHGSTNLSLPIFPDINEKYLFETIKILRNYFS